LLPQKSSAADYSIEKIFYMSQGSEKQGIVSLENNADKIDIIAPQFYGVSAKFQLTGSLDDKLKAAIVQSKVKVMPLVTQAGFKQSVIHNLLLSTIAQDAVIKSLVDTAKANGYIGWQFDFENISYLDKDLYSAFVERAAKSLQANGLILSVAVSARSVDYENTNAFKNWSGVFDYARIAKAADFVSLMAYDDPNSVGPVASLPFVNSVLSYVENKIPPAKLSLGIPLYNWGWLASPFKKVGDSGTYAGLLYIMSNFSYSSGFNNILGSSWLSYSWHNKQYQVWYQDDKSFQDKLDIIKKNNYRGFSAWVLGIEDPGIWSTISSSKK
jgi:spore germination protein YaaH